MTEPNPLFSTYRQEENRITSTILAVFAHINSGIVEDVLETLLADELSLLTFENQVRGEQGVPDGVARGPSTIYFETKRTTNAVDTDQLERHLDQLAGEPADNQRLLVLTPDAERPDVLDHVDDSRIEWVNFDGLSSAIETALDRETGSAGDATAIPTEREAFLLRELNRFLYETEDGSLLSGREDRVLVVPARRAWPEYEATGLYFCQPYRSFRPADHMAFYAKGAIRPKIPRINGTIESVELSENGIKIVENSDFRGRLANVIEKLQEVNAERLGREQKVVFLDGDDGITLSNSVENDKTAKDSDRGVAFVQNQRYVSLSDLRTNPEHTSELE